MKEEELKFLEDTGLSDPKILDAACLDKSFFAPRQRMAHKGNFGHCLLVAGSYGKAGACVLASIAALRTGCGLISAHVPTCLYNVLQTSVPELMLEIDKGERASVGVFDADGYDAVAIGPGIGTKKETAEALMSFLKKRKDSKELSSVPLVLDADGLNIVSQSSEGVEILKDNLIITPHPKEFERLWGKKSLKEKIEIIRDFAVQHNIEIVLKGGVTSVVSHAGEIFFNVSGNPGMATAGSGDVLTGIVLGVVSQGVPVEQAFKIGVYLHARAGDLAKEVMGEKSLIARDIVKFLPKSIMNTEKEIFGAGKGEDRWKTNK